ncbi:MAG: hypothetical protein WAU45_12160 [Blastocatellia bacterium]
MSPEALRLELLRMRDEDQTLRAELADDGSLFDGYHPRVKEVHRRNAARLAEVIDQHGKSLRSGRAKPDGANRKLETIRRAESPTRTED